MYLIKYRLAGEEKEGAKSSEVYARISRLSNGRVIVAVATSASNKGRMINQLFRLSQEETMR